MQRNTLKLSVLAAVAGTLLAVTPADAATLTYNRGDLFIGFLATSGDAASQNYLINIGQASIYRTATSPITLSLGNLAADLATFTSPETSWFNNVDVKWGVFGSNYNEAVGADPLYTMYAGRATTTPYKRANAQTQSIPSSKIYSMGIAYAAQGTGTSTANSTVATFRLEDSVNSFGSFISGDTGFQYFTSSLDNFGGGVAGATLNLFRMETGSASANGELLGSFNITQGGTITFSPVPEPSTIAFLALGAGLALFALRRRAVKA